MNKNLDHALHVIDSQKTNRLIEITSDPGKALRGRAHVLMAAIRLDGVSDEVLSMVDQLKEIAFELGRIYGKPTR